MSLKVFPDYWQPELGYYLLAALILPLSCIYCTTQIQILKDDDDETVAQEDKGDTIEAEVEI